MYYTFQPSKIWENGNPVDPNENSVTLKGKTEHAARKKLPEISVGRVWVLISSRSRNTTS